MKKLVVTMMVVLAAQAAQAEVICEKRKRYWYPKNETAKMIAETLKVKTCNGDRFRDVVAASGQKFNVPKAVKRMTVEELAKKLKGGK